MGMPQIITSPSGEKLAVLPLAEYERLASLAEDASDVAEATAIMQRVAAGEEELLPADFANRLMEGENPVKVYRELRGMKARDLADKAGIKPPYLSEIESGRKQGALDTMKRIADALGVRLDDLA